METEKEPKTTAATIPRFKKPPTQKEKEYIHRFIESLKKPTTESTSENETNCTSRI
jgi:hypothetical protein